MIFFILLSFLFCLITDIYTKNSNTIIVIFSIILTFIVGLRDIYFWPDTLNYVYMFESQTPTLFDYTFNHPFNYYEKGFYTLGCIIKTFTANSTIYLIIIAAITFYVLYKFIGKYSIYQLIGLYIYASRFIFGRNFIQIRSALAIMIFLLTIEYITDKNFRKYMALSFVAFSVHHSIILAIPLYFIAQMNITKNKIIGGLIAAFIAAYFLSPVIRSYVTDFSYYFEVGTTYTNETSSYAIGQGLMNPLIYFQVIILLIFTFLENKLYLFKNYYTIRTGYFYSTLILIVFSTFATISGRGATILATLEIAIIPMIIASLPQNWKYAGFVTAGIMYSTMFYLNYSKLSFL